MAIRERITLGTSRATRVASVASRAGFSIVELIVVIVILGIIGTLVAPRLSSLGGKQARADAQAVAELLSIAARRDELTSQAVAVDFDETRGSIRMLSFVSAGEAGGQPEWRIDRLAAPASLKSTVVESIETDGNQLDSRRWRLEFNENTRRPSVALVLKDSLHGDRWRIELPAGSSRAAVVPGDAPPGAADGSIDLDASGRSEDAW